MVHVLQVTTLSLADEVLCLHLKGSITIRRFVSVLCKDLPRLEEPLLQAHVRLLQGDNCHH